MRSKAGRRGREYEREMEGYRKYFTTGKHTTQFRNAVKLRMYCEWIDKSPEELIKEYSEARENVVTYNEWKRESRKKILQFYGFLKSEGYSINYARTVPLGILSFLSANCERVANVTKGFDPIQIPIDEYSFNQEDLRKMFYYGDTEEKALLATAAALGYGSIDFLQLETQQMKNLIQEAKDKHLDFIQFIGKCRLKTSVQPRSHLTPEALECLETYIQLVESQKGYTPKYLWSNGQPNTHITNQGLNKKFKRIVEKAQINTYGKKVKFHLLRKFLYSHLQSHNRDIAKVIVAKKVNASDVTYIQNLNAECLRIFKETYKQITLNGDVTGKHKQEQIAKIEQLERAITKLSQDVLSDKTIIDTLTKKTIELEQLTNQSLETINLFLNLHPEIAEQVIAKLKKQKQS